MEEKQNINQSNNRILDFFVTTLNGMAYGLFATLIIGTIFATIGSFFAYGSGNPFCDFMLSIIGNGSKDIGGLSYILQILTGVGIGVGVGLALKLDPLKVIVLAASGFSASYFSLSTSFVSSGLTSDAIKIGDPLTIYLVVIGSGLFFKYAINKRFQGDIILIPLIGLLISLLLSIGIRYPAIYVTYAIQWLINSGTNAIPFLMGIAVAVLMGMALTAPISSAAIAAMIFVLPEGMSIVTALSDPAYSGLVIASGAAVVGCCTQMVGFAVQSIHDNKISKVISIGIGTSMLQFKNILRKPLIWLPTIIASAVLGPIVTCLFNIYCMGSSAGMGTAGLVGQIGTITSMGVDNWHTWIAIFAFEILLPALLVFAIDFLFRKLGWIKKGDLTI